MSASWIPRVSMDAKSVQGTVDQYMGLHDDGKPTSLEERTSEYQNLVNTYYNLVTDFYEWGWGQSFHFAVRSKTETFHQSIARHQHWLAAQMGLKRGMNVLDVGCGVGGPALEIARFTECHVTGLNINEYHIQRGTARAKSLKLDHLCKLVHGDFMKLPFEDNSFDAVYQIEATAHAPSKEGVYAEIFRVLKPGGVFGSYEWCLTDKYDAENAEHRQIKKGIEEGDGLPDIAITDEVVRALEEVGFAVEEQEDRALQRSAADLAWYTDLEPRYTPLNFQHTELGHGLLSKTLACLERLHVVAAGTSEVQNFLHTAAVYLVKGGQTGTFTPAFYTLARKPL
mmetsp:Transcript_17902/g.69376  ORF Transcript_17902/g.69376 Transcript_17902/m.69376 type:complete len:340 (+) Transcript_17902:25-1044(+)